MSSVWPITSVTLNLGLAYFLSALGIWLSFQVLGFADLTVDASFTTGGAVAAVMIIGGAPPISATLTALVAGAAVGLVTGLIHSLWRIQDLLAGILMLTALYSVNLRIMKGSNVPLLNEISIYDQVASFTGLQSSPLSTLILVAINAVFVGALIYWFLNTSLGIALQAMGDNPRVITSLGKNTQMMLVVGLAISNGLTAMSGALVAQYQGFVDIGMGIGVLVLGLAAIIIGENLLGAVRGAGTVRAIAAVAFGSIILRLVMVLALRVGLSPHYLKLATTVLVLLVLLPNRKNRRAQTIASQ